ncbi:ABC transporter permease [Halobellus limi]|uniref:ABC transporter permease n=1 Tax=Halobellus limi TaxID=699433 RepID=A0A1H5TU79_9EURY|nr:ABC transporter permease [Halobellus limi]QCC47229.1 ABC transporter permease [Halobellus limi]SEF66336.1 ABC-type antimicrobial peptide transport system, permease component [Halobellus limi]
MWLLSKLRAVVGIAVQQLRHDRGRTVLAVIGICLAVLSMTLLGSVGLGVIETGEEKFDESGRDLWVTGGPVQLSPGSVGGFENTVYDAHPMAENISAREDVNTAVPLAFQTVYISANGSEFDTLIGTGAPARGGSVRITEGSGFSSRDTHYADGTYDGPMTHEVVISPQTAELYDVGVNDTLYIGGSIGGARNNEFRIVGVSPTFSRFLGTPTVVLHLSELQELTGQTANDKATMITVDVADDADVARVERDLQAAYPEYDVRTNREQLQATLERQAVLLAAGGSLVVLAAIAGIALTTNLLLSLVYQQRRILAALRAQGATASTLVGVVGTQAILLSLAGGLLGAALTVPAIRVLNVVAETVVGFENVVSVQPRILLAGIAVALVIGIGGALVAGWRVSRLSPLEELS